MAVDTNTRYRFCACRDLQMDLNSMHASSSMQFIVFFSGPSFHFIKFMCRYVAVMNSIFSAQRSMVSHQLLNPF